MKTCLACSFEKPLSDFYVQREGKLGRQAICKSCSSARYYSPNKVKITESTRARRALPETWEKEKAQSRARHLSNPMGNLLAGARARAKEFGLEFNITADDVPVPFTCPVLGISIHVALDGQRSEYSPSIDRINPRLGYVRGNVRVISWRANRIKSDATVEELQHIIAYMQGRATLHRQRRNQSEFATATVVQAKPHRQAQLLHPYVGPSTVWPNGGDSTPPLAPVAAFGQK